MDRRSSPLRTAGPIKGRLKTPTRTRIQLLSKLGHSQPQICRLLADQFQLVVSQSTVSRIVSSGQKRRTKPSGRSPKINDRGARYLARVIRKGGWTTRRKTYKQLALEIGLDVSRKTIARALRRVGYRRCVACRRQFINDKTASKRLAFAYSHKSQTKNQWARILWSDECSFETGERGRLYVTRSKREKWHQDCIQSVYRSGRKSFMVWGAIGWGFKSPLVFLIREHGKRGIDS